MKTAGLLQEIEEVTNKWKGLIMFIDQKNSVKSPYYLTVPQFIYRFKEISFKKQWYLSQGSQEHQMQKDSLFRKCCWENWINMCRAMQLSPYCITLRKINLKWIRLKHET